ncbi:asparagine synthetase B [Sulfurovum lithotrophicum]|nr:asparagine synthetase B [Sulfurovum lithotrophicum]
MGYIPAPYSIYQNTYKLQAGHYLVYDLEQCSYDITQYWSVDKCYEQEMFDKSEAEVLGDLEYLLEDAIELRMVSDVPVGVFLSGGYDSSLVTALLSKNHNDLHSFTIGFEDKKYNEATHAKAIANYFGTKHTEQYISAQEMLAKVETISHYYDEPFGDSSAIPTMMVSELAKKDVTVALSADGGDEVFCGYSKYFFLEKSSDIFTNKFKKKMLQNALSIVSTSTVSRVNNILPKQLKQTNIEDKYNKFKRAVTANSLSEMFRNASSPVSNKDVKAFLKVLEEERYFEAFRIDKKNNLLNEMMKIDYKTFMVNDVLTKVDRATMSVSLEGREPLLDHRIVEYMARVPTSLKYKNRQGKYLSRQILYKHIPQTLIDKPKAGFQVPLQRWLQDDLKYLVEKYLDIDKMDDEIFNTEEIARIKKELFLGNPMEVNKVWFILMYEMWKEKWFD